MSEQFLASSQNEYVIKAADAWTWFQSRGFAHPPPFTSKLLHPHLCLSALISVPPSTYTASPDVWPPKEESLLLKPHSAQFVYFLCPVAYSTMAIYKLAYLSDANKFLRRALHSPSEPNFTSCIKCSDNMWWNKWNWSFPRETIEGVATFIHNFMFHQNVMLEITAPSQEVHFSVREDYTYEF